MLNTIPKSLKLKSNLLVVPGPPFHLRESEREIFIFDGHIEPWLIDFFRLLDGRSLAELQRELNTVSEDKISRTLDKVFEAGLLEIENQPSANIAIAFGATSSLSKKIKAKVCVNLNSDQTLLVVHQEAMKPSELRDLTQRNFQQKKPTLIISLQNNWARVGPFILPDETSCFDCYRARLMSNRINVEAYKAFEKMDLAWPLSHDANAEDVVASLSAIEIQRWAKNNSSLLCGRVLFINLNTFEFEFETVLKVPYCKTCDATASW